MTTETLVLIVGTIGLIVALVAVIRKKRPDSELESENKSPQDSNNVAQPIHAAPATPPKNSWWNALSKTRDRFSLSNKAELQELREALEEACIITDLGVSNTHEALDLVPWTDLKTQEAPERILKAKENLAQTLLQWIPVQKSQDWLNEKPQQKPYVIWFVGVNGVGKTTSIAKLANELKSRGHSVLLAAGDTFRAAAGEQLETWAKRLEIECIKGAEGADSSSVLFDAIHAAKARNIDFVLADSAGRLHNQSQLMEALAKNKRVMAKALETAPHETLLVLDAHTGQNMLHQAEQFQAAVGLSGLILTKVDGSARGGAIVAVSRKTGLPIRRLGLGEKPEDFVGFDAQQFSRALLGLDPKTESKP